ncbi:hypothetical protein PVT01_000082100 [Plasmodium vivax]|uniref:Uncharacterized protein n=1 Tax=Plasmodium vivax TaxID=5855 RepID=A0A1G4EDH9_PLAVI|nr:hypothetical protein PVT01_000082100 [Plasmodium vivax]
MQYKSQIMRIMEDCNPQFTPLRSVFNKLIHKNRSPINNLHEVPEDLLEYMIKSGGKNRDNAPNYIAYQPT